MRTALCERLGCELPIFAFSHCRDVIVEVTKAGGFGVLGAATVSPQQLEAELRWIDRHVGGKPYGVDVIIPTKYDTAAEAHGSADLASLIPPEHKAFMAQLLADEGVPPLPPDAEARIHKEIHEGRGAMTPDGARALVRTALEHPQVKLVVSALGAPPEDVVADVKRHLWPNVTRFASAGHFICPGNQSTISGNRIISAITKMLRPMNGSAA